MLNEFYDFIAKRIFRFFQEQADQGILQPAESFCLKLDDEEMVLEVKDTLNALLNDMNSKGTYDYQCMDGSTFRTSTMRAKNMEIIIAAQTEGMTSDFLGASLRNAANEAKMPLLMITANPIDSALSGSRNMAASGMPFYSENLIAEIKQMIAESTNLSLVDKSILKFELDRREEDVFSDKSALYEYRELLAIMSSGKIEPSIFPGFRLFYVDGEQEFQNLSESNLKKEIKENHSLYERLDRSVRFGNIENDLASDFEEKFIQEIIKQRMQNQDHWSEAFTYQQVKAAMEKKQIKKDKPLQIDNDDITAYRDLPLNPYPQDAELFIRNEGSQKTKRRTKNILIFNTDHYHEVSLRVECNIKIPNGGIQNESEPFERDNKALIFKFEDAPILFRKIEICDQSNKIKYVFKVCVISIAPQYLIPTIKTSFVIDYKKTKKNCKIKLLGVGSDLSFNQSGENESSKHLDDNQDYSCDYKTRLHLYASNEELETYGNGINISISFADVIVPFVLCVDEAKSQEITGRRILRDKFAYKSSFVISGDSENGDLKLQRDAQEYFVKENLQRELSLENCIIRNKILTGSVNRYHDDRNPSIKPISLVIDSDLQNAYMELLEAFSKEGTTPTLGYIGTERIKKAAKQYLNVFFTLYSNQNEKQPLTQTLQDSLLLGTLLVGNDEDEILMTPFHPLNVAYQLELLKETGFDQAPDVIIDRLNSVYLLPYLQRKKTIYKVSDQLYSMEWKHYAPVKNRKYMGGRKYVPKLVEDKISEFTSHFRYIFDEINNHKIRINLINMGDCSEILQGIAQYYCHAVKRTPDIEKLLKFEINVYTSNQMDNAFNFLKDTNRLRLFLEKEKLSIDSGTAMNDLEGILAKRVNCYFHPDHGKDYAYAHISFYEMESEVTSEMATMDQIPTGVSLGGILSGVPSSRYGLHYRTGYGSKYAKKTDFESIVELLNSLIQVGDSGNPYQPGVALSTQIDMTATGKMQDVYRASNWVVFVDPKVDLDFFCEEEAKSDLLIIHYSDQYTTSSGYDAVTVTQKSKQYSRVIQEYLSEKGIVTDHDQIAKVINLFNAVNGDWLLRLISSKRNVGVNKDSTFSREKISIVAAIKLMLAYLKHPEILWVPISMEEMLRVSGGAGLSQREGILSAKNLGFEKGATSDDLLFVGLHQKEGQLQVYFYPTEVKTGNNPSSVIKKAFEQASATATGLENALNPQDEDLHAITYKVHRNFMMQLLINSCKKMQVYHVDDTQNWDTALEQYREQLLNEEYIIANDIREGIGKGAVLSFKKDLVEKSTSFKEDVINYIEVPEEYEYELILKSVEEIAAHIREIGDEFVPLCDMDLTKFHGQTQTLPVTSFDETADEYEELTVQESDPSRPNLIASEEEPNLEQIVTEPIATEPIEYPDPASANEEETGIHVQFGTNRRDGSPVIWMPNDTDQIFHTNTGIIGTMGTGKTQFTKSLITQLYREQSKNVNGNPLGILIFDYKGDYNESKMDFVTATNATVLKPYHLPFNPFALTKTATFKPLLPIHTANAFKDTVAKAFGLGPKQQDTLFQCILDAYHRYSIWENDPASWDDDAPTFETVYQIYANDEEIKKNDSLASAMNKLHQFQVFEGESGKTQSLFDLLNGVVVIDLSGYDADIQSLIVAITLDLFYAQMQGAGSSVLDGKYRQLTKMILVDEADNFMSQGFPSLKKILKEGREFGVGTILSTQFLKHFGSGDDDYAKYILTWIVHNVADLKSSDVDFVFNTEAKSEQEQKLFNDIKHMQKHNSIVKIGTGIPVYVEDLAFWQLPKE